MVICASLPSLRAFVGHIAPKLLGIRQSSPSKGYNNSNSVGLVTFGGTGGIKKKKGVKLSDDLYGLETVQHEVDISVDQDAEAGTCTDSDSQKGILQTRTTTVSSQPRGP